LAIGIFDNIENLYQDNIAVINDRGDKISYSDLDHLSIKLSNNLPARCLVFCLNKNTLGSFCGYYSFLRNKIVPLMLESKIDIELLEKLISIYDPEYIWLPSESTNNFPNEEVISSIYDYTLLKRNVIEKSKLNENLALLLATSGSTGSPKFVKLTYENIKSNALSIINYLSIDQNERPITTLPMSYSYGLSIINSHLYAGATILITNKTLFEKDFWNFLKMRKATSLSGVPYTYEMLKKLRFFRMELPHLVTLTQAGGKMNDELNKEFAEFSQLKNRRFFVMYGQTEATARMSYLPPEYSLTKLGSMGNAIPGGEFSIINESGQPLIENNIVGELVYKGKNVSMGYAECAEGLIKGDENKGVLITGDLAKRDDDGFYYIVGRKKRFIKIFGNRVNLDETERLLKNIIPDCACMGEDDKMQIFISDKARIEEVRNFISMKIGIHHSAFSVKVVNFIPKNTSGKTIYSELVV
jgi:long-chain acyl-CoA synthetase